MKPYFAEKKPETALPQRIEKPLVSTTETPAPSSFPSLGAPRSAPKRERAPSIPIAPPPIPQPIRHPGEEPRRSAAAPVSGGVSLLDFPIPDRNSTPNRAQTAVEDNVSGPQFHTLFESQGKQQAKTAAVPSGLETLDRLDFRQQVFLLFDYGYQPKEIAEQLNRTLGEVETILNLRKRLA